MSNYVLKRYPIEDLVPGMVLGKVLLSEDGKIFLHEGAVLTLRIIQSLPLWGIKQVEVREELIQKPFRAMLGGDAASIEEQLIAGTEEPEIVFDVPEDFVLYYESAVQVLKKNLGKVRFMKEDFDAGEVRRMLRDSIYPMIEDAAVLDNLQMMSHSEDYLYHHSVDVGIISGCIGLWMGQTVQELEETILGALLHDAGKALIPLKVLNKPASLTEEEMNLVRFHSVRGYKFLKEYGNLPPKVLLCALQHHERIDGSGYPMAVQGDKIHPYAKIVAVADVFDAMTSARKYGRRVTTYEALEIMKIEMTGQLDETVWTVFMEKQSKQFIGDIVQLSNGQRGEVIILNPSDCTRPVVRTKEGVLIDLAKRRDLSICRMLHS